METIRYFIIGEDTVRSAQLKFSSLFPYLSISFFDTDNHCVADKSNAYCMEVKLKSINKKLRVGVIEIDSTMTVADFENQMKEKFGLSVQLSRLSGNSWIQTSLTDHLTLDVQNKLGEELRQRNGTFSTYKDVPFGC